MNTELHSKRRHGTKGFTISELFHGNQFICHFLEDEERDVKIPGKTAIPCGRYRVTITWSNRFQRLMPLLMDVPGYTGIRIHNGRPITTAADTEGCLLPGSEPDYINGTLKRTAWDYLSVYRLIEEGLVKGEVWLTIT